MLRKYYWCYISKVSLAPTDTLRPLDFPFGEGAMDGRREASRSDACRFANQRVLGRFLNRLAGKAGKPSAPSFFRRFSALEGSLEPMERAAVLPVHFAEPKPDGLGLPLADSRPIKSSTWLLQVLTNPNLLNEYYDATDE